jgi:hypothetical protein
METKDLDPSEAAAAGLAAGIESMVRDIACLATMLKEVLEHSRVRVIGGHMRGRCQACHMPHVAWRPCPCPHHKAVELLKEFGITLICDAALTLSP